MYPQIVAGYFGLTANPANQSGGTNYATSGAKNASVNTPANGGFTAAIPTVTQISGYLSTVGNRADAKALYLVSSGGNDVSFASGQVGTGPFPADPAAYLSDSAGSLAMAVAGLASAGAKTIVVANQPASFPMNNAALQQLRAGYNEALFSGLAARNVPVIEADINSLRVSIQNNPGQYGFTSVSNEMGATACTTPAGVTTAWALLCSSSPGAPSTYASPSADTTSLFADDEHLSTAGQQVVAKYVEELLMQTVPGSG